MAHTRLRPITVLFGITLASVPAACGDSKGGGTGGAPSTGSGGGTTSTSTTTASAGGDGGSTTTSTSSAGTGGAGGAGGASTSGTGGSGGTGGAGSSSSSGGTGGAGGTGGTGGTSASSSAASSSSSSASSSSSGTGGGGSAWSCDSGSTWLKGYGDAAEQMAWDVASDPAGNVVVVGYFKGTIGFGGAPLVGSAQTHGVFVAKLDPSGNHLWSKAYPVGSEPLSGLAVDTDAKGNVIVGGALAAAAIDFGTGLVDPAKGKGFVFQLDPSGSALWTTQIPHTLRPVETLDVDPAGNVIVAGSFSSGGNFTSFVITKLAPSGAVVWEKVFPQAAVEAPTVRADALGNILVSGYSGSAISFGNGALVCHFRAKLDPSGSALWGHGSSCSGGAQHTDHGIAVDAGGDVYLAVSPSPFPSYSLGGGCVVSEPVPANVLARIDGAQGTCKWIVGFDGNPGPLVAVDDGGAPLALDGSAHRVRKWSPSGDPAPLCESVFPGQPPGSTAGAHGFTLDPSGRLLVTGGFTGGLHFTNAQIMSAGQVDVFATKL